LLEADILTNGHAMQPITGEHQGH